MGIKAKPKKEFYKTSTVRRIGDNQSDWELSEKRQTWIITVFKIKNISTGWGSLIHNAQKCFRFQIFVDFGIFALCQLSIHNPKIWNLKCSNDLSFECQFGAQKIPYFGAFQFSDIWIWHSQSVCVDARCCKEKAAGFG